MTKYLHTSSPEDQSKQHPEKLHLDCGAESNKIRSKKGIDVNRYRLPIRDCKAEGGGVTVIQRFYNSYIGSTEGYSKADHRIRLQQAVMSAWEALGTLESRGM